MRKKKPIVPLNKKQTYISGRVVSPDTNRDLKELAKKIKK